MEQAYGKRKKPYSASFYQSRTVFFGSLLFLVSQFMQLIQLFEDVAARKAANQAPPEDFTVSGIVFRALMIGLLLAAVILLRRHQSGKLHMGKTRLYLLAGALLTVWAAIRLVDTLLEMFVYPEFILVLDCLAIGVCVIAPIIMLTLADLNRVPPDDNILLFLGIGGAGFSVLSTVIIAVVLRASYVVWRMVPELLFRAGLLLFAAATLFKALKLRAAYPLAASVERCTETPHKPKKRPREDTPFSLQLDDEIDDIQPYAPEPAKTTRQPSRPRPEPEPDRAYPPQRAAHPQPEQTTWQTGRVIVQGGTGRIPTQDPGSVPSERQTCPYCGKRMPKGFPNCPRCGREM